jgi:hypothetical protein
MAGIDLPGFEIEWCKDGNYILPDSGNVMRFNLNIVDKPRALSWFVSTYWQSLTMFEKLATLCVIVKARIEQWQMSTSKST